jgi:glycosyltransferase involved in cell wall biosynthesis
VTTSEAASEAAIPVLHTPRILVIIPAYNEANIIGSVIAGVRLALPGTPIAVVDDGSRDDTVMVARQAGAKVLSHPVNLGAGGALQTGYRYAVREGYDVVVQIDGDGQHDPEYVPSLVGALAEADYVIGSRFMHGESYTVPRSRRIGIGILRLFLRVSLRKGVSDPTSGFRALSRPVFTFLARGPFPEDFPDADVVFMLHRAGFVLKEIPVRMRQNPFGRSQHAGFRPAYYMFKQLLSLFLNIFRRYTAPQQGVRHL